MFGSREPGAVAGVVIYVEDGDDYVGKTILIGGQDAPCDSKLLTLDLLFKVQAGLVSLGSLEHHLHTQLPLPAPFKRLSHRAQS